MAMTLITTNSGANQSVSNFTSGITNKYKLYVFKLYDINPATDVTYVVTQGSLDGGSNYNVTMTTTTFRAYHGEAGLEGLGYQAGSDQAQGTAYQRIQFDTITNMSDSSCAGELFLFDPSSTVYVKHFYSRTNFMGNTAAPYTGDAFTGGYFNTTSAINAMSFKMTSGNFDGTIKLYGVG